MSVLNTNHKSPVNLDDDEEEVTQQQRRRTQQQWTQPSL